MSRNARIGLRLFAVYLTFYAGFVALSAFRPQVMEQTPYPGINLAIILGFGLIMGALLLAFIYGLLCNRAGDSHKGSL
jgi:uncharacterized membrane protein (DUF485 family)